MNQYFIADIGCNHNQDFERCLTLISEAKRIGFDAVKFQAFIPEKLYKEKNKQKELQSRSFPLKWLPDIKEFCKVNKIDLGFSVFDLESLKAVEKYSSFLKISSFEVDRQDLFSACSLSCEKGKKLMIVSTGLCDKSFFKRKMRVDHQIVFMHCVSKYPTKVCEANLKRIKEIEKTELMDCSLYPVGYSDHTGNPFVILKALELGCSHIEMHLDLNDRKGYEAHYGHCWNIASAERFFSYKLIMTESLKGEIPTKEELKMKADKKTGYRS